MTVAHCSQDNAWFVFQVDVRSIAFLKNTYRTKRGTLIKVTRGTTGGQIQCTFMEIISMMDVKIPASHLGDAHIMTTEFGCLDVPNDIFTIVVLVTDFHNSSCNAIDSLSVHVESIPSVRKFDHWICFEGFLKEDSFDCDSQMDEIQRWRNDFWCKLQLNG